MCRNFYILVSEFSFIKTFLTMLLILTVFQNKDIRRENVVGQWREKKQVQSLSSIFMVQDCLMNILNYLFQDL